MNCLRQSKINIENAELHDLNVDDDFKFYYVCDECAENYKLYDIIYVADINNEESVLEVKQCVSGFPMHAECDQYDIDDSEEKCSSCNDSSYPYDFTDKYICIEKNYLENQTFYDNCEVHDDTGCIRCEYGYYLYSNNECLTKEECFGQGDYFPV